MYMRLGHVSSSKSHPIPNALFLLYEYFKNKFGRAEGSVGLITYKVNKYRVALQRILPWSNGENGWQQAGGSNPGMNNIKVNK